MADDAFLFLSSVIRNLSAAFRLALNHKPQNLGWLAWFTPSEGGEVAKLVDCYVRVVNLKALEERITKLNDAPRIIFVDDVPKTL